VDQVVIHRMSPLRLGFDPREPSKKLCSSVNRGALDRKVLSLGWLKLRKRFISWLLSSRSDRFLVLDTIFSLHVACTKRVQRQGHI
jgi:hypothetical protein